MHHMPVSHLARRRDSHSLDQKFSPRLCMPYRVDFPVRPDTDQKTTIGFSRRHWDCKHAVLSHWRESARKNTKKNSLVTLGHLTSYVYNLNLRRKIKTGISSQQSAAQWTKQTQETFIELKRIEKIICLTQTGISS